MSVSSVEKFVKNVLGKDSSGHDWYHIDRVRNNAMAIRQLEMQGSAVIIEYASLLHDVADKKLVSKIEGEKLLSQGLALTDLPIEDQNHIRAIVLNVSFNGGHETEMTSIEGKIVRDADRLDALGAIGIARTFAYGGKKGRPLYDPAEEVRENMTEEQYRTENTSSVHHFYEKLFKLRELMTTETGKKMAEERHVFMEQFIHRFHEEWKGTK
ncbi:HD domain-containing protein [Bacillus sp. 2205SS5-2]|uniref:HD domain-containing protein n=1 Tax=Bacillus sp. 2205SS5-2 TaxID=3109031 RepID=UPI003004D0CD